MEMKSEGFLSEFFRTYSDIIVSLSILKESFLILLAGCTTQSFLLTLRNLDLLLQRQAIGNNILLRV